MCPVQGTFEQVFLTQYLSPGQDIQQSNLHFYYIYFIGMFVV